MQDGEPRNSNGTWWRDSLVREITLVLVVKITLIFALWWLFFDLPENQRVTTPQVGSHLFSSAPPAAHTPKEKLK